MMESTFDILGNLYASKKDNKKSQGLRRDLFKRDIFALGTNTTEVLERILFRKIGMFDYGIIKSVAWSFS